MNSKATLYLDQKLLKAAKIKAALAKKKACRPSSMRPFANPSINQNPVWPGFSRTRLFTALIWTFNATNPFPGKPDFEMPFRHQRPHRS